MTSPRRDVYIPEEVGIYHCMSRCVRRAFLCGFDKLTGRSFEHRRAWLRSRLAFLGSVFAMDIIAYAVMSNHLHCLIRNRPDTTKDWSPEEIARRWRILFPKRWEQGQPAEPSPEEIAALVGQPDEIRKYRERLSCISWFHRCLNENIARMANAEDDCTGRFWEGRFISQRVDDVAGILATAAYVDLNPIRAGMAQTPEESDHTSVQDRIHERMGKSPERSQLWAKVALVSIPEITGQRVTLDEYLELVDKTGRHMVHGKAALSEDLAPIFERLCIKPESWLDATQNLRRRFSRIVGPEEFLRSAARKANKCWFQGLQAAREIFGSPRVAPQGSS